MAHGLKYGSKGFAAFQQAQHWQTVEDRLDQTFGPNPCQSLVLEHADTGERVAMTCDGKRCPDCGPRKQALLWLQLREYFGEFAYVGRLEDPAGIAEKARKRRQRGQEIQYVIVGDAGERIIVSNERLHEGQRRMQLGPWRQRVCELYSRGLRLRMTREIGHVTLCHRRRRVKRDIPSRWGFRTGGAVAAWAAAKSQWHEERNDLTGIVIEEWGSRYGNLPIPY